MCCHNSFEITPPLCVPIQCGAAINKRIDNILHDDEGENISQLNKEYCELTAHYFVWKNIKSDFYGFCHYRRFFAAERSTKRPYLAKGTVSSQSAAAVLCGEKELYRLADEYDIITTRSEDMGITAKEHYCTSKHHFSQDLQLFVEILTKRAPQMAEAAEEYLNQSRQYFCNMFIMSKECFDEYCGILFPVLSEFDKHKNFHGDFQSDRTDGYLGEIFTGIFITFSRKKGRRIKELPRLDIGCTGKKRFLYSLLPPESKLRFLAKRFVKRIRG